MLTILFCAACGSTWVPCDSPSQSPDLASPYKPKSPEVVVKVDLPDMSMPETPDMASSETDMAEPICQYDDEFCTEEPDEPTCGCFKEQEHGKGTGHCFGKHKWPNMWGHGWGHCFFDCE